MTVKELFEMLDEREITYDIFGPGDVHLVLLSSNKSEKHFRTKYTHVLITDEPEPCYYMIEGTEESFTREPDWTPEDEVVEFEM